MKKKHLFVAGYLLVASAVGAGVLLTMPVASKSADDIPGIVQRLDNHDARITNLEGDVGNLQSNTNTPPADHVTVPTVNATSTPIAAPQTNNTPIVTPDPIPTPPPAPLYTSTYCQTNTSADDGTHYSFWEVQTYPDGSRIVVSHGTAVNIGGDAAQCPGNARPQ